jgi:hypothetical protein
MRCREYIAVLFAAILWGVVPAETVFAGVTVPMSIETMADYSGQVISGMISGVQSYWKDEPRRIESEITFSGVEYLKGRLPQSEGTFRLIVPGGKVGDVTMRIGCAPRFSVGDKWLLFLLPSYKTFPVVGIAQGAFQIRPDKSGIERVYGNSGSPVLAIEAGHIVYGNEGSSKSTRRHMGSRHTGAVDIVEVARPDFEAMQYVDFVRALLPVLEKSRPHELRGQAGRRIIVEYTPVPIKRSGKPGETWHPWLSERAQSAVRRVNLNHRGQADVRRTGRGR